MFVDWESSERSFRLRLDALAGTAGVALRDLSLFYLDATGRGRLCDIGKDIARTLSERSIEMVIVDSASAAVGDTLSPADATATMSAIKSWGIPALLGAHSAKGAGKDGSRPSVYGAQAWTSAARLAILAEVEGQNEHELRVAIRNGKPGSDLGYIVPSLVTFRFGNGRISSVESSAYVERAEAKSVKQRLIEAFRKSGRAMLVKELGEEYRPGTFRYQQGVEWGLPLQPAGLCRNGPGRKRQRVGNCPMCESGSVQVCLCVPPLRGGTHTDIKPLQA